MLNKNIYNNLLTQFEKVFKHNRQGSYKTKQRYAEAFKRFLAYLSDEFRLERIANIAPKHIFGYTNLLQKREKSAAYIKTELSAIRFFNDQIPNARYQLPSNEELSLKRRQFGKVDRTWSEQEFNLFIAKAIELNREEYAAIFGLARYAGLRLHECFRIDTQIAAKAVKTGIITIKGKGGLVRDVPINLSIEISLKKMLAIIPRGQKLFVNPNDKTHLAMNRLEAFICEHRQTVQDEDSVRPLVFHGLRHTYAVEKYEYFIKVGCTEIEAHREVSKLLGHNRDEVTRIYLASLRNGGDTSGY